MLLGWMVSEAMALSCLWGVHDFNLDRLDGMQVPANVVIVGSHTYGDSEAVETSFRLFDEADNEVSITVEWQDYSLRITPDADLEPGDYRLIEENSYWTDEYGRQFTVSALDDEPAELDAPVVNARRRVERDLTWGDSHGVDVRYDLVPWAAAYEIELSDSSDFTTSSLAVTTWDQAFLGDVLCGPNIADYEHGRTNWVRVRAIGWDGSASAWSEPAFAEAAFLGCSVQPGAPVGGAALVLMLALASARRRRP
ncbi:MAG: hypothetical protein KTR31_04960 [Myxococcales bacterium]|nr:hypothetical protein [Myxococcales bacterium]